MSQSTHGGARKGAGRKPSPDRLIRIDARLSKNQIEFLKSISPNVSKALRTLIERRLAKPAGDEMATIIISDENGKREVKLRYTVWAVNSQGASTDVAHGAEFTSISAATKAARSEMGSGWKIKVADQFGEVVKEFTIH